MFYIRFYRFLYSLYRFYICFYRFYKVLSVMTRNAAARFWLSLETYKLSSPSTFWQNVWPYFLQGNEKKKESNFYVIKHTKCEKSLYIPLNGLYNPLMRYKHFSKTKFGEFFLPHWGFPDVSSRLHTKSFTRNPNMRSKILKSSRKT